MNAGMKTSQAGRLLLVSVGVGEPDNITLRAYKLLQEADLIVGMASLCKSFAFLLHGKQVLDAGHGLFTELARKHLTAEQAEHEERVVQQQIRDAYAKGKLVVVLEMGDPCLFGPQAGYLQAFKDLQPEVVAGVSSFNAANALLAQPLLSNTHQRVQLSGLQALYDASADSVPPVWVLFSMGLDIPQLISSLQRLYSMDTPITLVMDAGFADQRLLSATVKNLSDLLATHEVPWACLIYVGVSHEV